MNLPTEHRPHILFLFSDTGGGHRSASEAIIEALGLEYGERISTQMVDVLKEIAPQPLDRLPDWYPYMTRVPRLWGLGYQLTNGRRRTALISDSTWPYVRRALRNIVVRFPADMVVSLHPLSNAPLARALGKQRPKLVTVVTDMVSTHAMWYHPGMDLCIVATEEARRRALRCEVSPERVHVVGIPVADRFCQPPGDHALLRQQLGWPHEELVVLLMGGGEGMGPLEETAQAIAKAKLPVTLVVIAGRNSKLKDRLEAQAWPMPTFIYGFVREMPDFMRAADVLVTKAGPGTISEALNAGLPLVLYSRLPGQEDGNVSFVLKEGVGVWAPNPVEIVSTLQHWIENPVQRAQVAENCLRAARPLAARQVAHLLAGALGVNHFGCSSGLPSMGS
jgi:1,2-diacylglycerol 3-beta-galactosyltransferase